MSWFGLGAGVALSISFWYWCAHLTAPWPSSLAWMAATSACSALPRAVAVLEWKEGNSGNENGLRLRLAIIRVSLGVCVCVCRGKRKVANKWREGGGGREGANPNLNFSS